MVGADWIMKNANTLSTLKCRQGFAGDDMEEER
jgi:hypothetical protein